MSSPDITEDRNRSDTVTGFLIDGKIYDQEPRPGAVSENVSSGACTFRCEKGLRYR